MEFTNLFSSSKGNSLLVTNENTKILIDAGLAGKNIVNELKKIDVNLEDIDAILVTHGHSDHVKGVGVLSRKADIPIYANKAEMPNIKKKIGSVKDENLFYINEEEPFYINDLLVNSFSIPHDTPAPVGYTIEDGNSKCGIATDMGMIMDDVIHTLADCKFVFLESNHDINMLKNGSYPYELKRRILSPFGHLSNEDSGKLLSKLIKTKTQIVRLGHLSEENNDYNLALDTVKKILLEEGIKEDTDFKLDVAKRWGVDKKIIF